MSWQETMQTPRERCWKWAVAAWLLLTPVLFYVGFQQVFSTHADYDDEGYVMLSLASVMQGHALYDETYTQYGPFFFASQSLLHNATGLPVTHDVVRVKTLFVWVLAATLLMSFAFIETRSWRLAAIVYLLAFFHLDRLCLEPGHPQEFCVLAIAFSLWISQHLMRGDLTNWRRGLCAGALGAVIGATIMVKLNIGVFLFVSSVLLLLLAGPRNRFTSWLLYLGGAGAVALPILVTQSHILQGVGLALPAVCACAMFGVLAYCRKLDFEPRVGFLDWFCFSIGGALTLAATIQWTLSTGTTWEGLRHGLIGQHLGFKDSFFTPAPLHTGAILAALALAAAAWRAPIRRTVLLARVAVAGAFICALLQYLPESSQPLLHGMHDRGAAGPGGLNSLVR